MFWRWRLNIMNHSKESNYVLAGLDQEVKVKFANQNWKRLSYKEKCQACFEVKTYLENYYGLEFGEIKYEAFKVSSSIDANILTIQQSAAEYRRDFNMITLDKEQLKDQEMNYRVLFNLLHEFKHRLDSKLIIDPDFAAAEGMNKLEWKAVEESLTVNNQGLHYRDCISEKRANGFALKEVSSLKAELDQMYPVEDIGFVRLNENLESSIQNNRPKDKYFEQKVPIEIHQEYLKVVGPLREWSKRERDHAQMIVNNLENSLRTKTETAYLDKYHPELKLDQQLSDLKIELVDYEPYIDSNWQHSADDAERVKIIKDQISALTTIRDELLSNDKAQSFIEKRYQKEIQKNKLFQEYKKKYEFYHKEYARFDKIDPQLNADYHSKILLDAKEIELKEKFDKILLNTVLSHSKDLQELHESILRQDNNLQELKTEYNLLLQGQSSRIIRDATKERDEFNSRFSKVIDAIVQEERELKGKKELLKEGLSKINLKELVVKDQKFRHKLNDYRLSLMVNRKKREAIIQNYDHSLKKINDNRNFVVNKDTKYQKIFAR